MLHVLVLLFRIPYHRRDAESAEIGVFLDQELFLLRALRASVVRHPNSPSHQTSVRGLINITGEKLGRLNERKTDSVPSRSLPIQLPIPAQVRIKWTLPFAVWFRIAFFRLPA